jgi:hypothetical protein
MTKKEFEAIGKRLLPELPGLAAKGQLLFMRPIGHTLRGIFFDRSIDPKSFYVWIFTKPLFVPAQHIGFNIGWRLRDGPGGSDIWNADVPNLIPELIAGLKREALPFLSRIQKPLDIVEAANSIHPIKGPVAQPANADAPRDPVKQQAIAYSLARAADVKQAGDALDQLIGLLREDISWQCEMADRARALKAQLVSDPAAAQRQLDAWEAETVKNLGLEEFWDGGPGAMSG